MEQLNRTFSSFVTEDGEKLQMGFLLTIFIVILTYMIVFSIYPKLCSLFSTFTRKKEALKKIEKNIDDSERSLVHVQEEIARLEEERKLMKLPNQNKKLVKSKVYEYKLPYHKNHYSQDIREMTSSPNDDGLSIKEEKETSKKANNFKLKKPNDSNAANLNAAVLPNSTISPTRRLSIDTIRSTSDSKDSFQHIRNQQDVEYEMCKVIDMMKQQKTKEEEVSYIIVLFYERHIL
jgi:hypothetical protein